MARRRTRSGATHDDAIAIYGMRAVEEVLRGHPDRVFELRLEDPSSRPELVELARERGLEVRRVDRGELDAAARGGNHQGAVAMVEPPQTVSLGELLDRCRSRERAILLALDEVQDAGNVGAMLRTAAAFDVAGVIVPKRRAVGMTAGVLRASSGYAWRVPMAVVPNLSRSFEPCREEGFWVVGTDVTGREPLPTAHLPGDRLVLVLGSEHAGMRRLVRERCDLLVTIPTEPGVESLNVASAAAVCLYEWYRRGLVSSET
jgi:23S rRNA (guanosine2251-2'-O)-methyltransferase